MGCTKRGGPTKKKRKGKEEGEGGERGKENGKKSVFLCMVVLGVRLITQLFKTFLFMIFFSSCLFKNPNTLILLNAQGLSPFRSAEFPKIMGSPGWCGGHTPIQVCVSSGQ